MQDVNGENDGPSKSRGMKMQDMKMQNMKLQDLKMLDTKIDAMKLALKLPGASSQRCNLV